MRTSNLAAGVVLIAASVLALPGAARAQVIQPTPRPVFGAVPAGLQCTAEALNASGFVDAGGGVTVYNVPANQGLVRVRATCSDALGNTVSGQSAPTALVPGGLTHFGGIDFGATVPIAARLTIAPPSVHLVGLGTTLQLAVGAAFADLSAGDVTAASAGTTYRTSNPSVASVSPDGQVKAVGPGTALVYALSEGAGGLVTVSVLPASLQSLDVVPASLTFSLSAAFPAQPAALQVTGLLSDGSTVDWTSGTSGVTYHSSDPTIVVASRDGLVIPVSPGAAVISVTDGPSGIVTQIPVDVTTSTPSPFSACAMPSFAHNVDVSGTRAFVADGFGGLQIVNTGDCTTAGVLLVPDHQVIDVRVNGSLAALALGDGGFSLVNVVNIAAPSLLSTTTSIGLVRDLWISGQTLYVASSEGLFVYDIASPATPVLVGTQAFGAAAQAVAGDSTRGIVVVLTAAPSLEVIRTSGAAPWASVSVALPPAVNQADDVVLLGTSAYVANGRAGIHEIDVTNPASPSLRSSSILDFDARGVAVQRTPQGTFVAGADDLFVNAVPLFDARLNNTTNINFAGFPGLIKNDADSTGVALGEGFGVVTTGYAGIQIFRSRPLIDNAGVAPVVTLTQPITGAPIGASDLVAVAATATDDVRVALVDFLVDEVVVATTGVAPFAANIAPGAPCTSRMITARATDLGGNVGKSIPVEIAVLCAEGQPCSAGEDCESGLCSGGACASCLAPGVSYASCAAVKAACPLAASGPFTIDPDGAGPVAPFPVYCEMKLGGGGWTMAAKLSNKDAKNWVDAKTSWTDGNVYGNTTDLSADSDAKSAAWGTLAATEMMFTDNVHKQDGGYVETTSGCVGGQTMSQLFTAALANYPDTSGQTFYEQCLTHSTYIPNWAVQSFCGYSPASPSISLNHGYITIARTDVIDTQAVISFYVLSNVLAGPAYTSVCGGAFNDYEADLGLGPSETDSQGFGIPDSNKRDLGSGNGCGNIGSGDANCIAAYPETVYVFVR